MKKVQIKCINAICLKININITWFSFEQIISPCQKC